MGLAMPIQLALGLSYVLGLGSFGFTVLWKVEVESRLQQVNAGLPINVEEPTYSSSFLGLHYRILVINHKEGTT